MEYNNDLISRDVLIYALTHKWDGMVTSLFDLIKALPSEQNLQPTCKQLATDCISKR